MGYEPCAPPLVISDTSIPAIEICLKTLFVACDKALAFHKLTCQVMAAWTSHFFTLFKQGDKVWLEARNLKWSIVNPKFAPKQEGPFTITKVLSPIVCQLWLAKMWKIQPIFHVSLLSPYWKNSMVPISLHHLLTLSIVKKNMKSRRFYVTMELQLTTHSWSNGNDTWPKKTSESKNGIWKMQSLLSPHTKDSILLFSPLNSFHPPP